MFIDNAGTAASKISVEICGGVVRSKYRTSSLFVIDPAYRVCLTLSIIFAAQAGLHKCTW